MSLKSSANALILATAVTSAEAGIDNKSSTQSITSSENIGEVVSCVNQTKSAAEQAVIGLTSLSIKREMLLVDGKDEEKEEIHTMLASSGQVLNDAMTPEQVEEYLIGELPKWRLSESDIPENARAVFLEIFLDVVNGYKKQSKKPSGITGRLIKEAINSVSEDNLNRLLKRLDKKGIKLQFHTQAMLSSYYNRENERLDRNIEITQLALATQEEQIADLERKINETRVEREKIKVEREKIKVEREKIKVERERLDYEIKMIELKIKEREERIRKIKGISKNT